VLGCALARYWGSVYARAGGGSIFSGEAADVPRSQYGDARLIAIVLVNLLGNAWKYTAKQPLPQIALRLQNKGGESIFYVADNGAGFDMAYADKLFAPFQRLHQESQFEGTGIGLATVKRIISRNGGRIWAEAAVAEGATFFFTLGEKSMMIQEQTILLVEDNDDDAELAVRAFHRAQITNPLIRARDGVEALDYLFGRGKHAGRDVRDLPAVTLLDLNLPKINGLEVLQAIRSDERTNHLPVVILTSSNEDKDRLGAYDHFANSYVIKPVDYDQFVAAALQLGLYWMVLNAPPPQKET
jgi:two-component system response regulator